MAATRKSRSPKKKAGTARARSAPPAPASDAALRIAPPPTGKAAAWVHGDRSLWLALLTLLVLALTVYGRSLGNGFVLDDEAQILANESVHSLAGVLHFFAESTMYSGGAAQLGGYYYKPIMTLAYALLWAVDGANGIPFHLAQLLLHCTAAFLAFRFWRHFFSQPAAFALAAFFLLHPINTEIVVYSADLQDTLYMAFGLAALNVCARAAAWRWRDAALAGALLFLALLSKETGVLYVLVAALFLLCFRPGRILKYLIVTVPALLFYAHLRLNVAQLHAVAYEVLQIGRAPLGVRLLTIPAVLWHYVHTFLWPANLTVTQDWVVSEPGLTTFVLPLLGVLALTLGGAAYWWKRRETDFLYFAIWATLGFGLHSQLVPLDGTVADRWFYFTSVGVFGSLATMLRALPLPSAMNGRVLAAAAAALALALGTRAYFRSMNWVDGMTLYTHDVAIYPESFDLQNNVGVELLRTGHVEESLPHFQRSTELAPSWNVNWNNLAAVDERLDRLDDAEVSYRRSIDNGPYYLAYENYVNLLLRRGKNDEAREFLKTKALRIFPQSQALLKAQAYLDNLATSTVH